MEKLLKKILQIWKSLNPQVQEVKWILNTRNRKKSTRHIENNFLKTSKKGKALNSLNENLWIKIKACFLKKDGAEKTMN
jgi:hypothetical protein